MKKVDTVTRDGQNQRKPDTKELIDIGTDKPEHYDKEIYRHKEKQRNSHEYIKRNRQTDRKTCML